MSEDRLDNLLKRMPEIAAAENSFTSEVIQEAAFAALISAYGVTLTGFSSSSEGKKEETKEPDTPNGASALVDEGLNSRPSQNKRAKRSSGGSKDSFKFLRDLDLRPQGKKSFSDFAAEKNPISNEDKYAVAVYYLQHILEISEINADHVGTIFRLTEGWREPSDVKAALRVASARKGTIDTSNPLAIRTTPHGRNFVEHDLPAPTKTKK